MNNSNEATPMLLLIDDELSRKHLLEYLAEKYNIIKTKSEYILQPHIIDESSILKKKQAQVLEYLSEGLTYQEIADKMDITIDGSRFYVKSIYRKLNVHNVTSAIKAYQKQKIR